MVINNFSMSTENDFPVRAEYGGENSGAPRAKPLMLRHAQHERFGVKSPFCELFLAKSLREPLKIALRQTYHERN